MKIDRRIFAAIAEKMQVFGFWAATILYRFNDCQTALFKGFTCTGLYFSAWFAVALKKKKKKETKKPVIVPARPLYST